MPNYYDPSCPRCREVAGKAVTQFDDKKLCHNHTHELVARLRAENMAMQRRLMSYEAEHRV